MSHLKLRLLFFAIALAPLAASVAQRAAPVLVSPAAACTGAPTFHPNAVAFLPRDGATAPRNTRVWFLHDVGRYMGMFATRPTEPARVSQRAGAGGGRDVAQIERTDRQIRLEPLEGRATFDVWLPGGLPPPWGNDAGAAPVRALTFHTTDRDDVTAPELRVTGAPVLHDPGPTPCGPGPRISIPVTVRDESDVLVEVLPLRAGREPMSPNLSVLTSGAVWTYDARTHDELGRPVPTTLRLTPIDVAGNRGSSVDVEIGSASDGGLATGPLASPAEASAQRGCGKF